VVVEGGVQRGSRRNCEAKCDNAKCDKLRTSSAASLQTHPTPTLHPAPCTLHLHPTPYTLHPKPHTQNPNPKTSTLQTCRLSTYALPDKPLPGEATPDAPLPPAAAPAVLGLAVAGCELR
jgi:hypothetical protein